MNRRSKSILAALLLSLAAAGALAVGRASIINEKDLGERWLPAPGVVRVIPSLPAGAPRDKDVCVAIGYAISIDGGTSSFTQLQAWSSDAADAGKDTALQSYVQSAAAAVSMWKFAPKGRARAVFTVATFSFPGNTGADPASVMGHCEIGDLEDFVAKLQAEEQKRGNLLKSQMEKYREANAFDGVRKL